MIYIVILLQVTARGAHTMNKFIAGLKATTTEERLCTALAFAIFILGGLGFHYKWF